MCSHYQAIKQRERYAKHFGVVPPASTMFARAHQKCDKPIEEPTSESHQGP